MSTKSRRCGLRRAAAGRNAVSRGGLCYVSGRMGQHDALAHLTTGPGWDAFLAPDQYWRAALVLLSATASGSLLAFHPVYRGRPLTLDSIEQRKTIIIYSSVGALI